MRILLLYIMRHCRYILSFALLVSVFHAYSQENDNGDLEGLDIDDQLIIVADKGDTTAALKLISEGAYINATTYQGVTPLMFAAQNGNTAMVNFLMKKGANTGLKPLNGYTALIAAIRNGHIETVEYLIRNGADINLADNDKVTPLMHAIAVDSFYIPDMLLYYEAAVEPKNRQGIDALMLAAHIGRYEIAVKLIEKGAEINSVDVEGNTPLHHAAYTGQTDIMDLLILNGASLNMTNSSGYTPLSIATAVNNFSAARLLIGYGADVNSRINGSLNPLTLALNNKNDSLAKMLINQDAHKIHRPNFNQLTIGTRFTFNGKDSHLGFSVGISDSKYNLMANLGFGIRPKAIQVLERRSSSLYYQYWEKRRFFSFTLDKAFFLHTGSSKFSSGALAGFSEVLTFGSYKGSNENPPIKLLVNPRIGWICEYGLLRVKLSYEFMNLHLKDINQGWFNVSLELLINRKRGNIKIPSMKWL
jgi:ankyrin repeat protein